jgi:hypothetical protein
VDKDLKNRFALFDQARSMKIDIEVRLRKRIIHVLVEPPITKGCGEQLKGA